MKTLPHTKTALEGCRALDTSSIRICMHVRGPLRTDGRVRREAGALAHEGFNVTVVDIERERVLLAEEELDGIRVRHVVSPRWSRPGKRVWRLLNVATKFLACTLAVLRTQADVYHAHDLNALPSCYLAAKLRRKPLIYDAHEMPLYELDRWRWRWLSLLLKQLGSRIFRGCAGMITVSPPIAEEIRRRHHIMDIAIVRNVPVYQLAKKNDRLRQYFDFGSATRIALYQGNLQMDRGLDYLVHAAKFLAPEMVIVLMGKAIGNVQAELTDLIAREGVADRVKILPPVPYEELLAWTASADVGLIIYQPELSLNVQMCLPNKLFEYLMAGLPVLATRLDAVAEILTTYQAGQIISSLEPEEIGAAINRILANQTALEQMSANASKAALQELHWERECARLLQLYQRILAEI